MTADGISAMNSYDAIAEWYDEDMGRNNPGHDIQFFRDYARQGTGKVLELGCGTGRITLPLLRDGLEVVAVDSSAKMLEVLEAKARKTLSPDERKRLVIKHANMRDFVSKERFSLILCPFCAFTYLVDRTDQTALLDRVKMHLSDAGVFILDSFIPKYDVLSKQGPVESFDYERVLDDGTILRRRKIITQNLTDQINDVTRIYEFYDRSQRLLKTVRTQERIRYTFKNELEYLLAHNGFDVLHVYGNYHSSPYSYGADKMVFVASKRAPR